MTDADLERLIASHPVEGDAATMRDAFGALARDAGVADMTGLTITETEAGETRTLVIQPEAASGSPIVHLHGGGYVFGSPESHRALGAVLARESGRAVILPGYPLAPEHVWPAQRDAVCAFLRALGEPYVLSGDSAGGHLALVCALHEARPDALLLFSPNTMRAYGRSRTRGKTADLMNGHRTDAELARTAFGAVHAADPDQTVPGRDLSGLPRTFIDVGTDEILLDDSLLLTESLARGGVSATLRLRPGPHMIQLFAAAYAPGAESLAAAARWLRERA